jgi:hypothetical protein
MGGVVKALVGKPKMQAPPPPAPPPPKVEEPPPPPDTTRETAKAALREKQDLRRRLARKDKVRTSSLAQLVQKQVLGS